MRRVRFSIAFLLMLTAFLALAVVVAMQWQKGDSMSRLKKIGGQVVALENGYYVSLPDLVDVDLAIADLQNLGAIVHIHFFPGDPENQKAVLRTWSWNHREAFRRIEKFKGAFPQSKITFSPGAF